MWCVHDVRERHGYVGVNSLSGIYSVPSKSICFSHASAANTLMLLIKVRAKVTVYRGHRWTIFFLHGIISLFIMFVGIIRNNSLVGKRTRTEVCWTRPRALTTGPQGQLVPVIILDTFCYHFVTFFVFVNRMYNNLFYACLSSFLLIQITLTDSRRITPLHRWWLQMTKHNTNDITQKPQDIFPFLFIEFYVPSNKQTGHCTSGHFFTASYLTHLWKKLIQHNKNRYATDSVNCKVL